MESTTATLIFLAGLGQLSVLVAAAQVPFRLNWRTELQALPRLQQQMYWVYGGYVLMSIVALALISLLHAPELAAGGGLARAFCLYGTCFWGVRLLLVGVLDATPYLTTWWLRWGYRVLTVLFVYFTVTFGWAALGPVQSGF